MIFTPSCSKMFKLFRRNALFFPAFTKFRQYRYTITGNRLNVYLPYFLFWPCFIFTHSHITEKSSTTLLISIDRLLIQSAKFKKIFMKNEPIFRA